MAKKPEVIEGEFEEVPAHEGLVKYEATAKAEMGPEQSSAKELFEAIRGMPIDHQGDLDLAAEALAQIKGEMKRLEARRKAVTGPINEALEEVRGWFKPAIDYYLQAESTLKKSIAEYHTRCEAQNKLALRQAAEAAAAQDRPAIGVALADIQVPEKVSGLNLRDAWDFEVVSVEQVPMQYHYINETAVRDAMRASIAASKDKTPAPIPGIKFVKKTIVSSRAK